MINVIFILLLCIFVFVIFILNIISSFKIVETLSRCTPNQCKLNLITGIKTCPDKNNIIYFDYKKEICASKYSCDSPLMKYSVLSDGSSKILESCPNLTVCNCSMTPKCADYISSSFKYFNLPNNYKYITPVEKNTSDKCSITRLELSYISKYADSTLGTTNNIVNLMYSDKVCPRGMFVNIKNDLANINEFGCIYHSDKCQIYMWAEFNTQTNVVTCKNPV